MMLIFAAGIAIGILLSVLLMLIEIRLHQKSDTVIQKIQHVTREKGEVLEEDQTEKTISEITEDTQGYIYDEQ